jgi:nitrate/nitrite transporter NarK
MTAGCFAVMNLFARPGGGLFSDAYGRRKMLMICLIGQTVGYGLMSQMNGEWSLVDCCCYRISYLYFCTRRVWCGVFDCAVNSTPYDRSNCRHGGCLW